MIKHELEFAIKEHGVSGDLDKRYEGSLNLLPLQLAISAGTVVLKSTSSLALPLSFGLAELVSEAKFVHAFRTAVNEGDWKGVEDILCSGEFAMDNALCRSECEHLKLVCAFKSIPEKVALSLRSMLSTKCMADTVKSAAHMYEVTK